MNPQKKIKPKRNAEYLRFVRDHDCLMCCDSRSSAHHVRRLRFGAGTGTKPHDYCTLPLCEINECHNPKSEKKLNVEAHIIRLMVGYIKYKGYDQYDFIDNLIEFIEDQRVL